MHTSFWSRSIWCSCRNRKSFIPIRDCRHKIRTTVQPSKFRILTVMVMNEIVECHTSENYHFCFHMGYFFILYRIPHFIFSNTIDLSVTLRIDECLRLNFSFRVLCPIPICHMGYFVGTTAHKKINTLNFLKIERSSMVLFIKNLQWLFFHVSSSIFWSSLKKHHNINAQ
jgi:hypothetical protein